MNTLDWQKTDLGEAEAMVPISRHEDPSKIGGHYVIIIVRRPHYCDRGDFLIHVEATGHSRLDGADGFPRYFFGNLDEVKQQMETWVSRRKECQVKKRGS